LSEKPKILLVGIPTPQDAALVDHLRQTNEVVQVSSPIRALARLTHEPFDAIHVVSAHFTEGLRLGRLLQNEHILEGMPDGVALLDADNTIAWANDRLHQWCREENLSGKNFYSSFGSPEILGPDFCPFHTALATGEASNSTLRTAENHFFQVHAAPLQETDAPVQHLIVTVRDVTREMLQQQKLAAIHRAGVDLADLTTEEVFNMAVADRIELLKSNILHYTKELLNFDVVEVRLLTQKTGELAPLLSEGIEEEAARRPLFARAKGNGVTGFVAATGKSYLCEDTQEDPLYIEGCKGARSSLTVPLIQHDQVIGTFNVESPEPRAFSESDLQFLEIFCRDVAAALNTLELLVAQQANTAQASVEAIHREVALPVDEILNDAVNIMERYIGHEPGVVERLQRILRNARDIKQLIHLVGQKMALAEAVPASAQVEVHPVLQRRRVLVADADESVRSAAHNLLERFGCVVETAHEGGEATFMVRNSGPEGGYDAIIADIHLPDMTGYELLLKLQSIMDTVPMILMTGFGYDPEHSIVKARQAGLTANAILYKPFRLDQLLETVERIIETHREVAKA